MAVEARRLPQILLAEDQKYTLTAISRFLEERCKGQYEVVGAVQDGAALVKAVESLNPDVALVDISMPGLSGLDAIAELKKKQIATKIIVLTMHWDPEIIRAAMEAGAIGYVPKHRLVPDLAQAIEAALRGERFLSPAVDRAKV